VLSHLVLEHTHHVLAAAPLVLDDGQLVLVVAHPILAVEHPVPAVLYLVVAGEAVVLLGLQQRQHLSVRLQCLEYPDRDLSQGRCSLRRCSGVSVPRFI